MESDGFSWWGGPHSRRPRHVRRHPPGHFRGFEAYWEVPFSSPDSSYGSWTQGPGLKFFKTLEEKLGTLPIIAEDLGFLTPGVIDMRDNSGFPGMKILQFAFEGTNSYYLPHNYIANTVAYVGSTRTTRRRAVGLRERLPRVSASRRPCTPTSRQASPWPMRSTAPSPPA